MYNKGDRIRLVRMEDDPEPVPPGTKGTVTFCSEHNFGSGPEWQVGVAWDNGRGLSLCIPPDLAVSIKEGE